MTESDLLNILKDLGDDHFKDFKWHLKREKLRNIPPTKESELSKAERRDVVDLMVQKYEFTGAVEVIKSILIKISRNDLVKELPNISSGAEGQSQEETNMTSHPDSRSVKRNSPDAAEIFQKAINNPMKMNTHKFSPDRNINGSGLMEKNDRTVYEEIQESQKSENRSKKKFSECSALAYKLQISEVLDEGDTSKERLWKLMSAVRSCRKARDKERDLQYVRNYQPENTDIKHLRILLCGPVGAGKSSFIDSVASAVRGRMSIPSRCFTLGYETHRIQKGDRGNYYPFVFNNIMGLEGGTGCGLRVEDIKLALRGHVREGYKFNPVSPLSHKDPGYNPSPSADDRVHLLVHVCSANASTIRESVMQKMREIREAASDLGIPQVAIVTKIDEACAETEKDLNNAYKSEYLKNEMIELSSQLGIPLHCIFPVKNYTCEFCLDEDVDALILNALRLMIDFGDKINKM